jgi:hypothetical protein
MCIYAVALYTGGNLFSVKLELGAKEKVMSKVSRLLRDKCRKIGYLAVYEISTRKKHVALDENIMIYFLKLRRFRLFNLSLPFKKNFVPPFSSGPPSNSPAS